MVAKIAFPGRRELSRCEQVLEHFGGQEFVSEAATKALGVPSSHWYTRSLQSIITMTCPNQR